MSNLGLYQGMVVLAKKVGGPLALGAIVAFGGWALGRGGEAGGKGIARAVRNARQSKSEVVEVAPIFTVSAEAECGGGLFLHPGEKFRVLERDGDSVLIDLIGDKNSPYMVSGAKLASVSDFVDDSSGQ